MRSDIKSYALGLYEKSMPDISWEEKLTAAKEAGFDYVEMSIDATDAKIDRIHMPAEERRALINTMYDVGLPVRSMCVSAITKYAIGDEDPQVRQKGLDIAIGAVRLAADLGIRTVMIAGYDVYYNPSTLATKAFFVENIRKIADVAEREGVLVGFETMENEFMNTVDKAMKYVNITGSEYLKVYPDSGNITNAAYDWKDDVRRDILTGKGNVIAMHLKESKPGIYREVPYGEGHVDFETIIESAREIGVRRFVTEFWYLGAEDWKGDLKRTNDRFREILDRVYE